MLNADNTWAKLKFPTMDLIHLRAFIIYFIVLLLEKVTFVHCNYSKIV